MPSVDQEYVPTTFKWAQSWGSHVCIAGSFDSPIPTWSPIEMPKNKDGVHEVSLDLLPDKKYYFKFVVDNNWVLDQSFHSCPDSSGNWNHEIQVELPPPPPPVEEMKEEVIVEEQLQQEQEQEVVQEVMIEEEKHQEEEIQVINDDHKEEQHHDHQVVVEDHKMEQQHQEECQDKEVPHVDEIKQEQEQQEQVVVCEEVKEEQNQEIPHVDEVKQEQEQQEQVVVCEEVKEEQNQEVPHVDEVKQEQEDQVVVCEEVKEQNDPHIDEVKQEQEQVVVCEEVKEQNQEVPHVDEVKQEQEQQEQQEQVVVCEVNEEHQEVHQVVVEDHNVDENKQQDQEEQVVVNEEHHHEEEQQHHQEEHQVVEEMHQHHHEDDQKEQQHQEEHQIVEELHQHHHEDDQKEQQQHHQEEYQVVEELHQHHHEEKEQHNEDQIVTEINTTEQSRDDTVVTEAIETETIINETIVEKPELSSIVKETIIEQNNENLSTEHVANNIDDVIIEKTHDESMTTKSNEILHTPQNDTEPENVEEFTPKTTEDLVDEVKVTEETSSTMKTGKKYEPGHETINENEDEDNFDYENEGAEGSENTIAVFEENLPEETLKEVLLNNTWAKDDALEDSIPSSWTESHMSQSVIWPDDTNLEWSDINKEPETKVNSEQMLEETHVTEITSNDVKEEVLSREIPSTEETIARQVVEEEISTQSVVEPHIEHTAEVQYEKPESSATADKFESVQPSIPTTVVAAPAIEQHNHLDEEIVTPQAIDKSKVDDVLKDNISRKIISISPGESTRNADLYTHNITLATNTTKSKHKKPVVEITSREILQKDSKIVFQLDGEEEEEKVDINDIAYLVTSVATTFTLGIISMLYSSVFGTKNQ